jgi:KaiC/GvpD/RAD55 family RecA-like ATPase
METPFIYDRYVTSKYFIGRKKECGILGNLLAAGEHVVMYEPPKTGKMSLIQQTLINMRSAGTQFITVCIDMFNVRTMHEFLLRFGTSVLKAALSTPDQYKDAIQRHLEGTHFVFDRERFYQDGSIVSLNWSPDRNDMEKMMRLPGLLAAGRGMQFYVILKEFQSIMYSDEYETLFSVMEAMFKEQPSRPGASFVMTGSRVNAMKLIFAERKFFYRQVVHLPIAPVESRDIIEHVVRGFLYGSGKSFDRDLAMGACELFKCNLWYINHLASICDLMSKGFINESIMTDALKCMLSLHEPRFMSMMDDLTDHQISLLRAVLDGVVKFSASDVIEKYRLNSSANVRRVKDALRKKEVITFNEKDEPVILDPLFEYWLENHYFVK